MKLTNRLLKIASLVNENKRLADIGTDHGYIPVYLLNEGKINFAILADINKGPLENARSEVKRNKLEDKVDLRLGSGIEVLKKGEVDEVIIAGMGVILCSLLIIFPQTIPVKNPNLFPVRFCQSIFYILVHCAKSALQNLVQHFKSVVDTSDFIGYP